MENNQNTEIQQQISKPAAKLPIIAITQGDTNGVGYEVIFKAFETNAMFEICIPVVYGWPKAALFHKKTLELPVNFNEIKNVADAKEGCLNILNCGDEEVKINFGNPSPEAGRAAFSALERAVDDCVAGRVDALITAPINKADIQSDDFHFAGHTEYLESKAQGEALMILMNRLMRVALVTTHLSIADVAKHITQEVVEKKIQLFYNALRTDFLLPAPRIAVLGLNPHNGDNGLMGDEEENIVKPAVQAMKEKGIPCFGPYPADGFFGAAMYTHFDGILAMYHDQGTAPFKTIAPESGVVYLANLPAITTASDMTVDYENAGKCIESPDSFRHAVYLAIDTFNNRHRYDEPLTNPLKKLYHEKRDESEKNRFAIPKKHSGDPFPPKEDKHTEKKEAQKK